MKTLLMAGLMTVIASFAAEAKQPNVLFFCMDDLKPRLGCYGDEEIKTPNIDRLAQRGMLFDHHYVQQAVCGPSRASMFSGLRPDTTKVWDLAHTCREECPQAFTMQEYFKNNGYQTTGSGKIMHGWKNDDPLSWSVPYVNPQNLPYADGKVPALYQQYQGERIHAAYKELQASGIKGYMKQQEFMSQRNAKLSSECLDLPDDAYSDGAMTKWALGMLDRFAQSDKPFFLTLGYRKPHLPFVAPKKYWDLYRRDEIKIAEFREQAKDSPAYAYQPGFELAQYSDIDIAALTTDFDKQRELIHGYMASVSYIDAQIGKVLDELDRTGLAENTVIVLWGDHGWHLGDHNMWCKHSTFEQATRSPLIIVSPKENPGRSRSSVESVDIFPTLCELADLPVPNQLEGVSLLPVLRDPSAKVKDFSVSQYPSHRGSKFMGYALRDDRYRMVVWVDKSVATGAEFSREKIDSIQLYDYEKDPLETKNLANHPEYKRILIDFEEKLKTYFQR